MIVGVLVAASVAGVIALVLLLIFRKDLVGVDLSGRSLLRLYLYLASLAAIIVFAIGVSATLDSGMSSAFGGEVVYGRPPVALLCPVGEKCVDPEQMKTQYTHENEQRQQQDLLRGLTLMAFGALFWGGHFVVRRSLAGTESPGSALRRAYDVLGTFVFGVATVILLPVGIYFALSVALLPSVPDVFRQGVGDSLSGGLVVLPIWLVYLQRIVRAAVADAPVAPPTVVPSPAR
ncbi:MAG: hypothetical protein WEE03_04610 [Chloroflexota bacterium]